MKYYIGFPISFHCNLRCSYCYNQEFFHHIDEGVGPDKWHDKRTFSLMDYKNWRDNHLFNATNIIMHLFGGEPFCNENKEDVFDIIDFMDKEKIDILSNGICDSSVIENLSKYK
jgi:sulfatase maturation enzyme AslB (radical SAM superfamily)